MARQHWSLSLLVLSSRHKLSVSEKENRSYGAESTERVVFV